MTLDWDAPDSGGSPITDYRVQYREAGALTWRTFPDGTSTATAATVTLLVNGTTYRVPGAGAQRRRMGAPVQHRLHHPDRGHRAGGPASLTATPGNQQVTLTWSAPADDGGSPIPDYQVQYRTGGGSWGSPSTRPASRSDGELLTNGTTYEFQVRAATAIGPGPWSATASATPAAPPPCRGPRRA